MAGSSSGDAWQADPLKASGRPAMPCDLCEAFRVGIGRPGQTGPDEVTMAMPHPPFRATRDGGGGTTVPSMPTIKAKAKAFEFELYGEAQAPGHMENLRWQAERALCAEALRVANQEVVGALQGVRACSLDGEYGAGQLLEGASNMCASDPYPQFPLGVALLLPSASLGNLLGRAETHVSLDAGSPIRRVFVNGIEAISYSEPPPGSQVDFSKMPTYIIPRRGGVGLSISNVSIHATKEGGRLHFRAQFYAGAHLLSKNVVAIIP